MNTVLSFDDVLMVPKFSTVRSRKDVDPSVTLANTLLQVPVISSNMDTVTGVRMANAIHKAGGIGCLHRFMTVDDNVAAFKASPGKTWVSVGLGNAELERAEALFSAGAQTFVVDVAHGASQAVVEQAKALIGILKKNSALVIGNFATADAIEEFMDRLGGHQVEAFKVGIGGGSACLTRVVTGCGLPTFGSIMDCSRAGYPIIADGGIRNSGDLCKALAAGATGVMLGKMLAGTDESPSKVYDSSGDWLTQAQIEDYSREGRKLFKKYRGSASAESYTVQGKTAAWRSPEGDSFTVPYVGSVANVLEQLDGGLRSCMSYNGASTVEELQRSVEFVRITQAGNMESGAHGKR